MRGFFSICIFSMIFLHAADWRKNVWESTEYIWNLGLSAACDVNFGMPPIEWFHEQWNFPIMLHKKEYTHIQKGNTVWVRGVLFPQFCKEILPNLTVPFILVINHGDESFPGDLPKNFDLENVLQNKNILHIFAQNCDYVGSSKKITPIPIGLDYHTIAYNSPKGGWGEIGTPLNQEAFLKRLLQTLKPTYLRKKRIFVDFQHSDTMHGEQNRYLQFGEDRNSIFQKIVKSELVDYSPFLRRSLLWERRGEYAFTVSPHGNGLDCHRTWEGLVLGCIVIVKTSPLDRLYEGLPVVIIKDWSEITEANLDRWMEVYGDAFTNPAFREKLTQRYWLKKIREA